MLNPKITGFANHFRHSVACIIFGYIDNHIYFAIRSWIRRRHPKKNWTWRRKKYFGCKGMGQWRFFAKTKQNRDASSTILYLKKAYSTRIIRHVKIKGEATPYNPAFSSYFENRAQERKLAATKKARLNKSTSSTITRNRTNKSS